MSGSSPQGDRIDPASGDPPRREVPAPPPGPAALREALLAFCLATAIIAALYWIGHVVVFVQQNLGGLVALVFLATAIHLLDRRGEPLSRYGITWRPLGRGLAWGMGATVVILAGFVTAYVLYYDSVCGGGPELLGPLGRRCSRYVGGLDGLSPRLPEGFWAQAAGQLVIVAIPEEIFYRGYLLGRLEQALPPTRRLMGVPVGWALVLQAVLFGLGHFLIDLNPLRLAVAIPALGFGYLRLAGGSVVAPVIFHASANILVQVVDSSFFR